MTVRNTERRRKFPASAIVHHLYRSRLFIEFGGKDSKYLIDSLLFEFGTPYQLIPAQFQHAAGSVAANSLEFFNDPRLDFVHKFIEVNVVNLLSVRVAVHVNFEACQLTGQLDIGAALSDGQ